MQNIKTIKELGSGGNGSAYLIEIDGQKLVYKIERHDVYDYKKPLTSEYLRQVRFNDDVAQHHPEHFMILHGHGIIKNCKYVHPNFEKMSQHRNENRKRRFLRKNNQNECYYLIYSPYLEGTLNDVKEIIFTNQTHYINYLYQMINIINIMYINGYSSNDFNFDNIMYKKLGKEYQWYLIDYGQIWHRSFPLSQLNKDLLKRDGNLRNNDLLNFLIFSLQPDFMNSFFIKKYNMEFIPFKDVLKQVTKQQEYKQLVTLKLPVKNLLFRFHVFRYLYPEQTLLLAGASDNTISKLMKDYYILPFNIRYDLLTHIYDKNYEHILNKIKNTI